MTDDRDDMELLAAELTAEAMRDHEAPLPTTLAATLMAQGRAELAGRPVPLTDQLALRRARRAAVAGWLAAAAAVTVAVAPALRRAPPTAPVVIDSTAALRSTLTGSIRPIAWTATQDSAAAGASGDVVWSDSAQAGVMRITGLAANNPDVVQYQLWIFDAGRDERYPVDGGVFDVPAGSSEVLVPVRAKIRVGKATLFAVTVERPGGVVVSDRSRIVLLAQRGS